MTTIVTTAAKVGLWVVFTSVAVLLLGVLGFAVTRSLKSPSAPAAPTAVAAASGASAGPDVLDRPDPDRPGAGGAVFRDRLRFGGRRDATALAEVVRPWPVMAPARCCCRAITTRPAIRR